MTKEKKYSNDVRIIEELKKVVTETYWQNADGRSEEINITEFIKRIDNDYQDLKKQILENLEKKDGK